MKELTDVEKFYVDGHPDSTNQEVAETLGKGIGPKTIASYREEKFNEGVVEKHGGKDGTVIEAVEDEAPEERIKRLAKGPQAGKLIARQPGVTVMTQASSEISDAKDIVRGKKMSKEEYERINSDRIAKIK